MTLDASHGESEGRRFAEMLVKKEDELSPFVIRMKHLARPREARTNRDNTAARMSVVICKDTRIRFGEAADPPIRKRKAEPGKMASKSLCRISSYAIGFELKEVGHWVRAVMPNVEATRPAGGVNCNHGAMAGLDPAH